MRPARLPRQRGAIFILFAMMVLALLSMAGMALDLALAYNRKVELQALADAAALAAARELNGTAAGVDKAVEAAASAAATYKYRYNVLAVPWSDAALRFAAAPGTVEAGWIDAASAAAAPATLLYAKVDTAALAALDSHLNHVPSIFMRAHSGAGATLQASAHAIAGRLKIPVTPLAICAQGPAQASRANTGATAYNELVEYGFRRGVAYNLMQLNPGDTTPEHFLIDPLTPPGLPGAPANFSTAVVGPFVCAGAMLMPSVTGGPLSVQRNFPLASLYLHLNSRFDNYTGNHCTPEAAPPDSNIKSYLYAGIGWMNPASSTQVAAPWISGTRLWTRADPLPGDASNTAPQYGPLWAYARAVPYSAYSASPVEPASGYATFGTADWSRLYTPGPPAASGYPSATAGATPYSTGGGAYFQPPSAAHPGQARRRVLNVALLSCPVPAGATASATVLGVGRFFMTVPATATSLSAEFAGIAPAASLAGAVELQR
ncbi:pilus assembly protein TadG-related protein [Duganella sp.]|uniref:pilus assembly protein TadG-related protein n=1 Tax=Duganella sp. TaxID=1904440 RepID=UPI0031DF29B5